MAGAKEVNVGGGWKVGEQLRPAGWVTLLIQIFYAAYDDDDGEVQHGRLRGSRQRIRLQVASTRCFFEDEE